MTRNGLRSAVKRVSAGIFGIAFLAGCMSTSEPPSAPLENRIKLLEATVTRMELQSTAAVSNLEKRVQQLEEDHKTLTALVKSRPSIPSV